MNFPTLCTTGLVHTQLKIRGVMRDLFLDRNLMEVDVKYSTLSAFMYCNAHFSSTGP